MIDPAWRDFPVAAYRLGRHTGHSRVSAVAIAFVALAGVAARKAWEVVSR